MSKILIIEDDKNKVEKLKNFLGSHSVCIKESFQSGLLELKLNYKDFDLLILDMTIPLWEKGKNDLGGNYEQFGGEKILKEMKRRKLYLPTILFTMFDVFPTSSGNITFGEINNKYTINYADFYKGAVFYSANEENWKSNLSNILKNFVK